MIFNAAVFQCVLQFLGENPLWCEKDFFSEEFLENVKYSMNKNYA